MTDLITIVSGGQTGADRAALDAAAAAGLPYRGFTPTGGWAEDLPEPPGLIALYPGLVDCGVSNPAHRTFLNVEDSDATLILWPQASARLSRGTALTRAACRRIGRPCLTVRPEAEAADEAGAWLAGLRRLRALNVAGPRESQAPGGYAKARRFLEALFSRAPFAG